MIIVGTPSASYEKAVLWSQKRGATPLFVERMMPPLWLWSVKFRIDPVGVICQSFKETGGGKFAGKVKPGFHNTCGLKIRDQRMFPGVTDNDNPLAHQIFPNWEIGALAHVQHVAAYAGFSLLQVLESSQLLVDPRFDLIVGKNRLENWVEMSGRWAPSSTYGQEIEGLMQEVRLTVL